MARKIRRNVREAKATRRLLTMEQRGGWRSRPGHYQPLGPGGLPQFKTEPMPPGAGDPKVALARAEQRAKGERWITLHDGRHIQVPAEHGKQLSDEMVKTLVTMDHGGGKIIRYNGGYWTRPGLKQEGTQPPQGAEQRRLPTPDNPDHIEAGWHDINTLRAMERRGYIARENPTDPEWKSNRILTDKGRDALSKAQYRIPSQDTEAQQPMVKWGERRRYGPETGTDWQWQQKAEVYLGERWVGTLRTVRRGRQIIKTTTAENGDMIPGHDVPWLMSVVEEMREAAEQASAVRPGLRTFDAMKEAYDPSQARDPHGKWTSGGGGAKVEKPQIYMRPADLEKVISWGEEKWLHKEGRYTLSKPLSKDELPETMYHTTINKPAVVASGALKAQSDGGGLGGGSGMKGVSLTTSESDAQLIQTELTRAVELAHQPPDVTGKTMEETLTRYSHEDEKAGGLPEDSLRPAVEYAMDGWRANLTPATHEFDDKTVAYTTERSPERLAEGMRSLSKDAFTAYLTSREHIGMDRSGMNFREFQTSDTPLKNPMLFTDAEHLKDIDSSRIGILKIPRDAIPDEALTRHGSDDFLHEIRVHADVPVRAAATKESVNLYDTGMIGEYGVVAPYTPDMPYGGPLAAHIAVEPMDQPGPMDPGTKFNLKPDLVDLTGYEPTEVRMMKTKDILPRRQLTQMARYSGKDRELSLLAKDLTSGLAKLTPLTVADIWYKAGEYSQPTYLTTPPEKISDQWVKKPLLLDGHRRLSAALALGIERVPVIYRKPRADNLLGYYGGHPTTQGPEPTAEAYLTESEPGDVWRTLADGRHILVKSDGREVSLEPYKGASSFDETLTAIRKWPFASREIGKTALQMVNSGNAEGLIAYHQGQPVGIVAFRPIDAKVAGGKVMWVEDVASSGSVHGTGEALMRAVAHRAAAENMGVWGNPVSDAVPFYQRIGWKPVAGLGGVSGQWKGKWGTWGHTPRQAARFAASGAAPMKATAEAAVDLRKVMDDGVVVKEAYNPEQPRDPHGRWWHGSPDGTLGPDTPHAIHVGTHEAAKEALEARIGIPAQGEWDGTREYGKTLLAGQRTMEARGIYPTGYNAGTVAKDDAGKPMKTATGEWKMVYPPKRDYYPTDTNAPGRATYGSGKPVPFDGKPNIFPVEIVGKMTNSPENPHSDNQANALIGRALRQGTAQSGYYYRNEGEDEGSISAVVPSRAHLQRLDKTHEAGDDEGCQWVEIKGYPVCLGRRGTGGKKGETPTPPHAPHGQGGAAFDPAALAVNKAQYENILYVELPTGDVMAKRGTEGVWSNLGKIDYVDPDRDRFPWQKKSESAEASQAPAVARPVGLRPDQIDLGTADPKRVRMVSVKALHPRLSLPGGHGPEHPEEVAEKIKSGDWKMRPLTAVKRPEGGLWIMDGHRRYGAAQIEGWERLPVIELTAEEAQEAAVWHARHVAIRRNRVKSAPEQPHFARTEKKPMLSAADIIREDVELMKPR